MPRSRRRSRVARQAKFLPRGFNDSAVWVVAGRALEILPLTNLVGIGDFQQLLHLTMAAQAGLSLRRVHWSGHPLRDSQLEPLTRLLTDRGMRNVAVDTDQARLFMDRRVPVRSHRSGVATQAEFLCRLGRKSSLCVVASRCT